jgi:hypothetical protein
MSAHGLGDCKKLSEAGLEARPYGLYLGYDNAVLASAAPSQSDRSFAQAICG